MKDYSYIGTGNIYLREYGTNGPALPVGNASALTLTPQEDSRSLPDYTTPGGGTMNEVTRLTGVNISYTFHNFSPANLARALRGAVADVVAGTATDEAHFAHPGGFTKFARIPTGEIEVTDASGTTTYEADVDYEVRPGGILVLEGGAIVAPAGDEENIHVSYEYGAQTRVEALVNPAKQYELIFAGMNEARSGAVTVIDCYKVSHGTLQEFAAIGDEYGAGTVNGSLLKDATRTGQGVSQYFRIDQED